MNRWALIAMLIIGLILSATGPAAAQTVVKNLVVIEADPAWVYAPDRPRTFPRRIGEVITRWDSTRYRDAGIEFSGRRESRGRVDIGFTNRIPGKGLGEIEFSGRRNRSGIGEVAFKATPAPGVRGTVRRVGSLTFSGISSKNI